LLVFLYLPDDEEDDERAKYAELDAWASLHSISRLKRPTYAKNQITIIFKQSEEKQPWIFNFIV
jgi:hypothetical protein